MPKKIIPILITLLIVPILAQAGDHSLIHCPKTLCVDLNDANAMYIDEGNDLHSESDNKLVVQRITGSYEINFSEHVINDGLQLNYISISDRFAYFPVYADNFNDDSGSIQAAIDLIVNAGGGTLLLPEGDILLKKPICIPPDIHSQVRISGSGHPMTAEDKQAQPQDKYAEGGTRLRFNIDEQIYGSNYPAIYFSTDSELPLSIEERPGIDLPGNAGILNNNLGTGRLDPWSYSSSDLFTGNVGTKGTHIVIEHLAILCSINSNGYRVIEDRDGLLIRGAFNPIISDVTISGFAGCGLIIVGSYGGVVEKSIFNYNSVGVRGYTANVVKILNCTIRENDIGLQNIVAKDSIIEANHLFGYLHDTGSPGGVSFFDGCHFEATNYENGGIGADICFLSDSYGHLFLSNCHFSSLRANTHNIFGRFAVINLFNFLSKGSDLAQIKITDSRSTIYDHLGTIDGNIVKVITENDLTVNIDSPRIHFNGNDHYQDPLTLADVHNGVLQFRKLSDLQTLKLDGQDSPIQINDFDFPVALHGGHEFKLFIYNPSTTAGVRFERSNKLCWGKNQPDAFEIYGDEVLIWMSITDPVQFQTKWYLVSRTQVL